MLEPTSALRFHWGAERSIINLRCDVHAPGVRAAITTALGLTLPEQPNTTVCDTHTRLVWIGPDEWQVFNNQEAAQTLETRLRTALDGQHYAVTDVSSYYQILHLAGASARDILAQGCPLDLHPRVFAPGHCAGSHYFKAVIWLWQIDTQPSYELLIRRSFARYVWHMIERVSR